MRWLSHHQKVQVHAGCSATKMALQSQAHETTAAVNPNPMAAMFAPSRGKALRHAIPSSPAVTLPRFLVPAWQTTTSAYQRQFSTTPGCQSKLGRTPIPIPPGVELILGEPKIQRGARDWKSSVKRTITVKGPLGMLAETWVF